MYKESFARGRHFVLSFKENSIDCIADGYQRVGTFATLDEVRSEFTRRTELRDQNAGSP